MGGHRSEGHFTVLRNMRMEKTGKNGGVFFMREASAQKEL
jgi:hypothetical protein